MKADNSAATVLWYAQPAQQRVEALPVGNGRLVAMNLRAFGLFGDTPDKPEAFGPERDKTAAGGVGPNVESKRGRPAVLRRCE